MKAQCHANNKEATAILENKKEGTIFGVKLSKTGWIVFDMIYQHKPGEFKRVHREFPKFSAYHD